MIIGIGNDIVDIRRIEKSILRFGTRFEERVFTATEIAMANLRGRSGIKGKTSSLAKRFAAKEACAKALGTGIGQGIKWREISVSNLAEGTPCLTLSGKALARLVKITPGGMKAQLNLSMSDEYPLAQAFVVISAVQH